LGIDEKFWSVRETDSFVRAEEGAIERERER